MVGVVLLELLVIVMVDRFLNLNPIQSRRWSVGLNTGIPRVRFSDTTPVPLYTVTHHGCDPYLTVIRVVSNETCGTFGTRGFFSLKILYIEIKYI